jgi:photosystem II stability/assembly factor-like uncharacterized protein
MARKLSAAAVAAATLAVTAAPAMGQGDVSVGHSGWSWSNPQPQGNVLRAIDFAGGTGYAAGDNGTLLRTTDGTSWTGLSTGVRAPIALLRVLSPQTVIFGSGCIMRRSDDGGQTFRRIPFTPSESSCAANIAAFHFPSAGTGYLLLRDGSVFSTADGGQSFGGRQPLPATNAVPTDIFFVNDTTGFAVAGSKLFRTTDGAQSWVEKLGAPAALEGVYFADPSNGYAVGDRGTVFTTTDGGDTWTQRAVAADAAGQDLADVRCASATVCLIATVSGEKLLRTTDGGATIATLTPSARRIYAAAFSTATSAVGVGDAGATVVSPDAGTSTAAPTFTPVGNRLPADLALTRVRATDASLVHATGDRGRIGRSTDGGRTWATVAVPTSQVITDVSFPDPANGFAVDSANALRVTVNGGAQWTPVDTGGAPAVHGLDALDRNVVVLFTSRGIWRSTAASDTSAGGTTFAPIGTAKLRKTAFTDFDRTNGSAIYAFGPSSIWMSGDRGASWRPVPGPVKKPRYRRVDFVSASAGFALTTDGRVWATRNGGRTWAELAATGSSRAFDMTFGDATNGYLAIPAWANDSGEGIVLRTGDGGLSWRPQVIEASPLRPNGLEAPSGVTAFALASSQDVFRTTTGGDRGTGSTITVKTSTRRLRKAGPVRVTVSLGPAAPGRQVALFGRSGAKGRWRVVGAGQTPAGGQATFSTTVRATTQFVAQWVGDAGHDGAGSRLVTVVVKK